jgi:hypothetical protein
MIIEMYRGLATSLSIPGEMMIQGFHAAWTLERPAVAIPSGTYKITLYSSPHFGRLMPMLNDVPGRSYILIHWGDYPVNSDGCILVGELCSKDAIWNTEKKFTELFLPIQAAVETEGCFITIYDYQPSHNPAVLDASDQ